ncbi:MULTISPECIES: sigma-70 family RNA polymerase sigma factor [Pseudomonas]|uniref:RNA polymerase subunit sigma n=1 Tax=Pseudomonas protegens TaxID=380021 RepID=A0A9Q6N9D6_9PSED|nr:MULTISPECIES: sigma-70 family RNA polymerase sigma factor [Pseudomonas]MBS7562238.1 sigma-70 family RNA polymerase sigma factor [Pseudomonas sp. RC4D1]MCO7577339.1 sigma-70 family RNA polymerase sigma factor [Pseudomonas protegens]MCO7583945.1 sigma-70 family RNA polymerase sigma factor [Pseudomonas chlororaphis]MCO7600722.1 sigma-70 family RNA polymerase sigma factor [Pseudomonas chlororaphis]MCY7259385.1 sigma-70 family RNA polymerase sigma factor [Pseudomonas protegens]
MPSTPPASPAVVHHLYDAHHRWLYELLRRRLNHAWDAADLAHEIFVRVLKRPPQLDGEVQQRSYLATIARGLCIDHWRRRQLEQAWLQALAARPQAVQPSPEQRAIIVETLHEVDAMLGRLPQRVREAFILAQLHGRPYREIAIELGVCERMVKKYLAQALVHCALLEAELDGLLVE